jgi:hypothetical protein
MIYHQSKHFQHLSLNTVDHKGKLQLAFEWTQVVRDYDKKHGFKTFIDKFMATSYTLFHSENPPRMFSKCKNIFQFNPKLKYRDWYIF